MFLDCTNLFFTVQIVAFFLLLNGTINLKVSFWNHAQEGNESLFTAMWCKWIATFVRTIGNFHCGYINPFFFFFSAFFLFLSPKLTINYKATKLRNEITFSCWNQRTNRALRKWNAINLSPRSNFNCEARRIKEKFKDIVRLQSLFLSPSSTPPPTCQWTKNQQWVQRQTKCEYIKI